MRIIKSNDSIKNIRYFNFKEKNKDKNKLSITYILKFIHYLISGLCPVPLFIQFL